MGSITLLSDGHWNIRSPVFFYSWELGTEQRFCNVSCLWGYKYFEKAVFKKHKIKHCLEVSGQHLSIAGSCCVSALVLSNLGAFPGSAASSASWQATEDGAAVQLPVSGNPCLKPEWLTLPYAIHTYIYTHSHAPVRINWEVQKAKIKLESIGLLAT